MPRRGSKASRGGAENAENAPPPFRRRRGLARPATALNANGVPSRSLGLAAVVGGLPQVRRRNARFLPQRGCVSALVCSGRNAVGVGTINRPRTEGRPPDGGQPSARGRKPVGLQSGQQPYCSQNAAKAGSNSDSNIAVCHRQPSGKHPMDQPARVPNPGPRLASAPPLPASSSPTAQLPGELDPGRITRNDVARLGRQRDQFASEFAEANARLISVEAKCNELRRTAEGAERRLGERRRFREISDRVGQVLDRSISRIGGVAIGVVVALAVTFIAGFQFGEHYIAAFACLTLAGTALFATWYFRVHAPPDGLLEELRARATNELAGIEPERTAARAIFDERRARLNAAQAGVDRAEQILNSRLHRLLTCDWRCLRGTAFEQFLGEVFLQLGYAVQMTGKSGDQGVDLIATAAGKRIAIQAKGYVESVGNHSVMEVHTGMAYYACNASMVITNSVYTRAVRDCAQRVGCLLIDGEQIPSLIQGSIAL